MDFCTTRLSGILRVEREKDRADPGAAEEENGPPLFTEETAVFLLWAWRMS
jgi:hypothetical protein